VGAAVSRNPKTIDAVAVEADLAICPIATHFSRAGGPAHPGEP